jgi:hypothetical protein
LIQLVDFLAGLFGAPLQRIQGFALGLAVLEQFALGIRQIIYSGNGFAVLPDFPGLLLQPPAHLMRLMRLLPSKLLSRPTAETPHINVTGDGGQGYNQHYQDSQHKGPAPPRLIRFHIAAASARRPPTDPESSTLGFFRRLGRASTRLLRGRLVFLRALFTGTGACRAFVIAHGLPFLWMAIFSISLDDSRKHIGIRNPFGHPGPVAKTPLERFL